MSASRSSTAGCDAQARMRTLSSDRPTARTRQPASSSRGIRRPPTYPVAPVTTTGAGSGVASARDAADDSGDSMSAMGDRIVWPPLEAGPQPEGLVVQAPHTMGHQLENS